MFFIMMITLTLLSTCLVSLVFIWAIFFWATMVFLWILKQGSYPFLTYFIVQEISGVLFLLGSGSMVSFIFLLLKLGVSPVHFWVFSVISSLNNFTLLWFNTIQKMPYLFPLILVFQVNLSLVLLSGSFLLIFHMLTSKSLTILFTLGAMESFNSGVLFISEDSYSLFFVFLFYWFSFWVALNHGKLLGSLKSTESSLWLMGFPLGLPFFFKFVVLGGLVMGGWGLILLLLGALGSLMVVWSYTMILVSKENSLNLSHFWALLAPLILLMMII